MSFSGSNPFLSFGFNPENGLSFYCIQAILRSAKQRVKGYSEVLTMRALNMFINYLKKGYGFKPGPKVMAWLVLILLISIAGSYILDMYNTTLDIRIKQRELNKTEESQVVQTSKRKGPRSIQPLTHYIYDQPNLFRSNLLSKHRSSFTES